MPIYEYQCSHCRYYLEIIQKISDARLRKCPSCGRNALQKLVSAPVFRLKGSGWYETDFKSDQEKKRNLAGADKEPASTDAGDKSTKADKADKAEPAAKPAATEGKPAASTPAAGRTAARKAKAPARAASTRKPGRKPARPATRTGRRSKR